MDGRQGSTSFAAAVCRDSPVFPSHSLPLSFFLPLSLFLSVSLLLSHTLPASYRRNSHLPSPPYFSSKPSLFSRSILSFSFSLLLTPALSASYPRPSPPSPPRPPPRPPCALCSPPAVVLQKLCRVSYRQLVGTPVLRNRTLPNERACFNTCDAKADDAWYTWNQGEGAYMLPGALESRGVSVSELHTMPLKDSQGLRHHTREVFLQLRFKSLTWLFLRPCTAVL